MTEKREQTEKMKEKTEKLWDATRKTLHTATFQAKKYKQIAQKKIDLASLHKKIATAHADLGKLVDDNREAGEPDIIGKEEVQTLFAKLDDLKHSAAELEEEIETIKAVFPPHEEEYPEKKPEEGSQEKH